MYTLPSRIKFVLFIAAMFLVSSCSSDNADELVALIQGNDPEQSDPTREITGIATPSPELQLAIGETFLLEPTVVDKTNQQSPLTGEAQWTSENPGIASIDTNGNITALSIGSTEISVSWRGFTTATLVSVVAAELQEIRISPELIEVNECSTSAITASAVYSDGTVKALPSTAIWQVETLPESVITPIDDGVEFSPAQSGSGSINASVEDILGSAPITVLDTLAGITLHTIPDTLVVGDTLLLSAVGTYNTEELSSIDNASTWILTHSIPETPSVTLQQLDSGLYELHALTTGSATLEISCGGITETIELTIVPQPSIQSIQILDGSDQELAAGESRSLILNVVFSDGQTEAVDSEVLWELESNDSLAFSLSNDPDNNTVLSVNENLLFEHQAVLTASWEEWETSANVYALRGQPDSLQSLSFILTDNAGNESLLINGQLRTMTVSETLDLSLQGEFLSGIRQLESSIPSWSNSDPSIVTVDSTGQVTAVAAGSASISAIANDIRISLPVTVLPN